MKNIVTTFILITGLALGAQAQELQTATYVEKTHFSPKLGTALGFEFANKFEAGGFYQKAVDNNYQDEGRPALIEEEFFGAYIACPLLDRSFTSVKFNIRTGVSNGENFVITPSVLANCSPIPQISLGGGLGIRALRPTLMASVSLNLSTAKTQTLALK